MKYRGLITFGLLLAAIVCYAINITLGIILFLIIGGAFELAFWFELFKEEKS